MKPVRELRQVPIDFLITGLGLGGAETQLVRLVTNLDRARWRPRLISMLEPLYFLTDLAAADVPVVSLGMEPGRPSLRALLRMIRLLRKRRPQVLVCFLFHANLLGRIAGKLVGVPVIISSIRSQNFGGRWRERALRLTDWLGALTTTNSEAVAQQLIRRKVVPPGRLRVVPNALAADAFWSDSSTQGLPQDRAGFTWLAVGRLEEAKDYPTLLQAFALVRRQHQQVRLRIAGDGQLHAALAALAAELGLGNGVEFLGLRRDVGGLLQNVDGFVLSSKQEGLPNVIMEAFAAGKPVVSTAVGGAPELVQEGQSGFLVPPGKPTALADAMLRLMDLPDEVRAEMGRTGRASMQARFSLTAVVAHWEHLCLDLLTNPIHSKQ